ncbi:hypothetical protein SDC9_170358 [bioreactor metagenome]|uniref:Uncharacterized protein n=1 Tax=bioreactor metagenome TaxID=1076179 RepID=A0A645GGV7_9ZZZZ
MSPQTPWSTPLSASASAVHKAWWRWTLQHIMPGSTVFWPVAVLMAASGSSSILARSRHRSPIDTGPGNSRLRSRQPRPHRHRHPRWQAASPKRWQAPSYASTLPSTSCPLPTWPSLQQTVMASSASRIAAPNPCSVTTRASWSACRFTCCYRPISASVTPNCSRRLSMARRASAG